MASAVRNSGGAVWASSSIQRVGFSACHEEGRELVKRAVPAFAMAVTVGRGGQALVTQLEFSPSVQLAELDGHKGFARVALGAPGERKIPVRFNRLEDAGDANDIAVRQMHDQAIASADVWLEQRYVAVNPFRADPGRPFLPV